MNKLFTTIFAVAVAFATASGQAQEIKGDAKAGETKNAMCIGCHGIKGYQSSFPEIYKVPMISGQSAAYISAALHAYKKGERKYPSMRGIAESLSDQDIADLAAYYEQHGKTAAAPAVPATAELPASLKDKLMACAACHGANFNNTTDPANPRLAGQHADYLYVALKSYQTNTANVGRANATMVGMAKPFSDSELKQIANFLGSLPGELKTVPQSKFR